MDDFTFGVTLVIVGMGGTLIALGLLAVMMTVLKKIFPVKEINFSILLGAGSISEVHIE